MEERREPESFMLKLSRFIVNKRKAFIALFAVPVFRRSTRKIPTFCFLESQKSNFTQPENPLFSTKFQCPIWAFFIEKIYFLWYNNSTS